MPRGSTKRYRPMVIIRKAKDYYKASGEIEKGAFSGRWHFSFGDYYDSHYIRFGNLKVFNDDILSPGATWPMHPHRNIEVVTYCVEGEFRHADEKGGGGVLKKGWVQHTTVGKGMWHSEINNREDISLRFIQMWFVPSEKNLKPSVEQKIVDRSDRTNKFCKLVSGKDPNALKINSDAEVYSLFLEEGKTVCYTLKAGRGAYLYLLEGGPIMLNENVIQSLGSAEIIEEKEFAVGAKIDAEILLVDTDLKSHSE